MHKFRQRRTDRRGEVVQERMHAAHLLVVRREGTLGQARGRRLHDAALDDHSGPCAAVRLERRCRERVCVRAQSRQLRVEVERHPGLVIRVRELVVVQRRAGGLIGERGQGPLLRERGEVRVPLGVARLAPCVPRLRLLACRVPGLNLALDGAGEEDLQGVA